MWRRDRARRVSPTYDAFISYRGEMVARVPGYWDSAEFDPRSRLIPTTHAELGRAGLFDAPTGRRLAAIDASAQSAAAVPEGRRLVVVDDESTAVIVGVSSRTFVPLAHPGGVWRAAFSGDRLVATRRCPPPSLKRTGHL